MNARFLIESALERHFGRTELAELIRISRHRVLRARSQGREPTHFYNVMADPAFTAEALGFAIMEVTNGSPNSHSGDFFQKQGAWHIAKAIHALRAMGKPVSLTTIYPVLTDARSDREVHRRDAVFPE